MSKKKSRMAQKGGGECNWSAIWKLGRENRKNRDFFQRRTERDDASIRDTERQEREREMGLNLTLVKFLLDNSPTPITLGQARETALTLQV